MKKKLTQNWCPPPQVWGTFIQKKFFMGGGGDFFPKKAFYRGDFCGKGLMIINLFSNHDGIFT